MKKVYLLPLFLLSIFSLSAQCLLVEVPLDERIQTAEYILEGKVIAQRSFWDDNYHNIYTTNTIQLYKIFKGNINTYQTVELITRGGIVDGEMQVDYPSLRLRVGNIGLFLLNENNIKNKKVAKNNTLYCISNYATEAYLQYDFTKGKAYDHFQIYEEVPNQLYARIEQIVHQNHQIVQPFNFDKAVLSQQPSLTKNIASFTPNTITAGTQSVLTINGSNFGNTAGIVEFPNADNGGFTINVATLASEIISWSDTQIEVEVPTDAGTGAFEVVTNSGTIFTSATSLTIVYNQLNAQNAGVNYQTQLVNDNGMGGITFQYFTDFANGTDVADASTPFSRAMNTWCEANSTNWIIGSDSPIDVATREGTNIVRFDNGNELPANVLGRATSYWSACTSTGIFEDWYVQELDIVFNDNFSWNVSSDATTGGQYDLQSVTLHELGHAHQLGHTINGSASSGDVMYFQTSSNTDKRTLSANDDAGASDVFSRSSIISLCNQGVMTTSNCGTLPVELMRFDGSLVNQEVMLFWQTASEINNAGFEIQRSQDAKNWKVLDFVKGYGTTLDEKHYKYYDREPNLGTNYYRLKQVDTDEKYEYSELISIHQKRTKEEVLKIFPNPASENIRIQLQKNNDRDYHFQLLDTFGRVLRTWSSASTNYDLSIAGLPNGSYTVIAKNNLSNFTYYFIKQ